MLRSRGYLTAVAIVSALDLDDMRTLLAPMFCRESMRIHVGIGVAAPPSTTACETPAIYHMPNLFSGVAG
jgi:hypothetical protein